jgi:hypothetical protein
MLYPERDFSPQEQREAKISIFKGLYNQFNYPWEPEQWVAWHDQLIQRVDLAASYFNNPKNNEKYPPDPYARFLPGTGYFDRQNLNGFRATLEWYQKKQVWLKEQRQEDALRLARKELRQHQLGKAPKRKQALSLLQLYIHHQNKIKVFGPEALERFNAQFKLLNLNPKLINDLRKNV